MPALEMAQEEGHTLAEVSRRNGRPGEPIVEIEIDRA
jgi:hypothetical protein